MTPRRADPSWSDHAAAPAPAGEPILHVVLHEPEIPNNTGNIGRTCVAIGAALHLIHPLGFDLSAKARRRAGLDYWPRLRVAEHADWQAYRLAHSGAVRWGFSTSASRPYFGAAFRPGDHLVFGKETAGLPAELAGQIGAERMLTIPMLPGERSLNLATAVCAALYEALRQCVVRGDLGLDGHGRIGGPSEPGFWDPAGKIRANRSASHP